MRALGLIPARGGSRGIPRKNLAPLAGRPLLAWTVEQALASSTLDRVVVSTDDADIVDVARSLGVDVIERPARLAADATPMLEVVQHALDAIPAEEVVLLQPTSPLRQAADVDAAVSLRRETGADSVVSVVRVPHNLTPGSLLRLASDGRLQPLEHGAAASRQEKPSLYARNGPAVLVVTAETVRAGSLYGNDSRAYEMTVEDSVDVDEPWDLKLAELLLERRTRLSG